VSSAETVPSGALPAGRVGRAHGLDGSFYVTGARPRLLALGTTVRVIARSGGRDVEVVRRAGTDEHPIVRLEGVEDRAAAESLRGALIAVELAEAPSLGEGEWWASELEGCHVFDGERHIGVVTRLLELPSCEALEVRLHPLESDSVQDQGQAKRIAGEKAGDRVPSEGELLIPMVRDAIRHVDPTHKRIDVDMGFVEGA
jgi:16S rRNA processing protein RimM